MDHHQKGACLLVMESPRRCGLEMRSPHRIPPSLVLDSTPLPATTPCSPSRVITLNVGGTLFTTTRYTLCRDRNSFFAALFSGRWNDGDAVVFIDRSPLVFPIILDYLRGMELEVEFLTKREFKYLQSDADFYGLDGLVRFLHNPRLDHAPKFAQCTSRIQICNNLATLDLAVDTAEPVKWNHRVLTANPFPRPFAFERFAEQHVKVVLGNQIMIGLAPNSVLFDDSLTYYRCGWFLFMGNGALYSQDEPEGKGTPYRRCLVPVGSVVSVRLYHDASVSFARAV
ncbi:hypothetical protein BASA81_004508 [Batrachochytrium salamandrivorans]|nr:hypothetical protein BASA81_004508 [Batrachochytrium salamandrivorans]